MPTCSRALLILALLAAATSLARSDGISNPGFLSDGFTGGLSRKSGSGGGGGTNFLLSNAGSALLVNTGIKFLVQ